jgi:alpha-tubulin suppressor-like RCC1 family protein
MDISNLIIQLQAKVNDLTYNQLAVAKSIELLKTGQVNYVDDISELPAATVSNGYMYYIPSLGIYYSNGTTWTTIDPIVYNNSAWAWGYNDRGQLGDNTTVNKSSPISVIGGFTDWCQISAGFCRTSLGVRQNGTAWGWGDNDTFGQLGDNSTVNKSSPVSVVGGFTDWCQVSSGNLHSLGVRTNGTAWAWGQNNRGQLGDNTGGPGVLKSSPVSVVGGFTNWCQISAGVEQSLAVRTNGTAWAWGSGYRGQLGDNTTASKSSPVSVVGGFTDWCQVSAGSDFSLGVRQNGTAWAWGRGSLGVLGNNYTGADQQSPVSVIGGFTDWCQISAGTNHSVAVRTTGTAWAWGLNSYGRLGDNTTVNKSSPVSVVGGFTDWCQIGAGKDHSLAVRTNGTAWSWGQTKYWGQLGTNSDVTRSSPVSVIGGFTDWCQISAGNRKSLAIRSTLG